MSVKIKELKKDALINVQVNKSFYFMIKLELINAIERVLKDEPESGKDIENIITKKYEDMTPLLRNVFTLAILVAEIERVATVENLFDEIDPSSIKED
jgi:hypothetical protein